MKKWNRYLSVKFISIDKRQSIDVPGLDVDFNIERQRSSEPNTCTLSIYNMSEATRLAVLDEFSTVQVDAGYQHEHGIIFEGQIRKYAHGRNGPALVTTLTAGDGDNGYRNTTVNRTWAKGTPVEQVIRDIVASMGYAIASDSQFAGLPVLKRAFTASGWAVHTLNELARRLDTRWSVQNGVFYLVANDGVHQQLAPVIGPDSGLVGTPRLTEYGVEFTSLLTPALVPNEVVVIESKGAGSDNIELKVARAHDGGGVYRIN